MNISQGFLLVQDYMEKFEKDKDRCEHRDSDYQLASSFVKYLYPDIKCEMGLQQYESLDEAFRLP